MLISAATISQLIDQLINRKFPFNTTVGEFLFYVPEIEHYDFSPFVSTENYIQFTIALLCIFFPLSSSGAAAGVLGGQEEAVHEGSSAGEAEERHRAGQDFPPHRQGLRLHDRGSTQRQNCGHQHGEQTEDLLFLFMFQLQNKSSLTLCISATKGTKQFCCF